MLTVLDLKVVMFQVPFLNRKRTKLSEEIVEVTPKQIDTIGNTIEGNGVSSCKEKFKDFTKK